LKNLVVCFVSATSILIVYLVPAIYIAIQAVLSLYYVGQTTGLVLDSGDGVTHTVPIYDGFTFQHAIGRLNLAGREVTEYLGKLLTERGLYYSSSAEKEIVREMKEQLGYVAEDFAAEMKKGDSVESFTLPDGKTIKLGSERFRCSEALFQPSLLGFDAGGLQHLSFKTIMSCDLDIRRDLFENVVLSGGTTCFRGFDSRLQKELTSLASTHNWKVSVNNNKSQREFSVWQGGSILASLESFRNNWITKEEYLELGSAVVHQKCF